MNLRTHIPVHHRTRRPPAPRLHRRGFTLVEAIATIVIIAVLMRITSGIIFNAIDGYTAAATRAELHTEMSAALDRLTVELRNIPFKAGVTPAVPDIASVTASSITWSTNSSFTLSSGKIMYSLAGGTSRTLMDDVTTFGIQTYDQSNTALAASLAGSPACDPIRRIQITLSASRGGVTDTLRTRVSLRNLMTGAAP